METETNQNPNVIAGGDTRYQELDLSRKTGYLGRTRAPGRRHFVAFNHRQNGNLLVQFFDDVWEKKSSWENVWNLVEPAEEKIEAFTKSDWVLNVTKIPGASTAEEAMALAREKFGMAPIPPAGKRGAA